MCNKSWPLFKNHDPMRYPAVIHLLIILGALFPFTAEAQDRKEKVVLDGEVLTALITEDNDTLLFADLEDIQLTSPRAFKSRDERRKYYKYRRYAAIVYPYAVEAVRQYREIETATTDMKKRQRRKYIRHQHKYLKGEFKDQLKALTKTQGYLLIKMVEKELEVVMFDLVKDARGGFNAFTYNLVGNLNGYSLKDGYQEGEDRILDMVLDDFEIKL